MNNDSYKNARVLSDSTFDFSYITAKGIGLLYLFKIDKKLLTPRNILNKNKKNNISCILPTKLL